MISASLVAGLIAIALASILFKHYTQPLSSKIRGPKSSSFILGNLLELFQSPVGQFDFAWQRLYGGVIRFKTVFGGDQLLVSDPKALYHIFNNTEYGYSKQPNLRILSTLLGGKGITWADGEVHRRHRKVLLPGFGVPETKAFLNIFQGCAESLSARWTEIVTSSADQKAVINIPAWLSRATLDIIGQAAFDVQFGTIHDDNHPLSRQFNNVMSDIFGRPSAKQIFVQAASMYVPSWILEWLTLYGSNPRLQRAREVKKTATEVARNLIREKAESLLAGKGNRDIFSILVKANMDSDAKTRLTEEELFSQMRTIIVAGSETAAHSLSWIILELARHPDIQSRLRSEIRRTEAAIRARGDTQFMLSDFDAMPYTMAVIKEGLRYHCAVPYVHRIANEDDILPLSRAVSTETGEVINEIIVPKGTRVVIAIAAYNRNVELWGADAHEFNPDRWLNGIASGKKSVSIGVYSNLMTFLAGARSCLGWRFALIEMQAILVDIVGKFEFAMTDKAERIRRELSVVMIPVVEGEPELGSQLPLVVSIATREDGN